MIREQLQRFRQLLDDQRLSIEDFEMNVDGETFRALMAGEPVEIEVLCRSSQVLRIYQYDGTGAWLDLFAADLQQHVFDAPEDGHND